MENIQIIIEKIKTLKYEMEHFEVDPDDYEEEFNQMLDEVYGDFMGIYSASYTLKCVDETAWRCGLLDYVDNLEISYPSEWDNDLEELIDELRDYIDDEIENLNNDSDTLTEEEYEAYGIGDKIQYLEDLQNEWC